MSTTSTSQTTGPFLTRKQAIAALGEYGIPISDRTLATMATRGGGPVFRHFGQRVLYKREDLLTWAHGRLGKPCANTSEARTWR